MLKSCSLNFGGKVKIIFIYLFIYLSLQLKVITVCIMVVRDVLRLRVTVEFYYFKIY